MIKLLGDTLLEQLEEALVLRLSASDDEVPGRSPQVLVRSRAWGSLARS
jgi:hypothetical protein